MNFKVGRLGFCFFFVGVLLIIIPPIPGIAPGLREFDAKVDQVFGDIACVCGVWWILELIGRFNDWLTREIDQSKAEMPAGQ